MRFLQLTGSNSPAAWNPTMLPNLSFFLDASQLSAGAITAFTELSPNAQSFTGTGTAGDTLNGNNGLIFNGTSDKFTGNSSTIILPEANTTMLWAVVKCSGFGSDSYPAMCSFKVNTTGSGHVNMVWGFSNDPSYSNIYWGSGTTGSQPVGKMSLLSSPTGAPHKTSLLYNGGGLTNTANWTAYDGTTSQTVSNNGGTGSSGTVNMVGAYDSTGTHLFNGTIYALVGCSVQPSAGDFAKLQAWGLTKYGL